MNKESYTVIITGIVQGVGFRPYIYNLAKSLFLSGKVGNIAADVIMEVEGDQQNINILLDRIRSNPPPLAKIKTIQVQPQNLKGYVDFCIDTSSSGDRTKIYISPDIGICKDCERELFDVNDRRYLYPFINCTNCGPRFTIIKDVPYDRPTTTMAEFEMCDKCAKEYKSPHNRRYHAQPVSCHSCGPKLELLDNTGKPVLASNIMDMVRKLIGDGYIFAVKGIGGYHLVCDAANAAAVKKLRKRKIRDDKPFAIMVKDYKTALTYCHINDSEKGLLESEKKPIVLLRKRDKTDLPDEIAPGNPHLGIMLPYTPVHMLLFYSEPGSKITPPMSIVATSGNRSSEPIYFTDNEAIENLGGIADFFLTNDREIFIRTDDSVTRSFRGEEYIIRRSRGYVPLPITCDIFNNNGIPQILACGGELKNTFCMNKDNEFYLSHHIGDLENAETLESFEKGIEHFKKMFDIDFAVVAFDLHPEYLSTKYADCLNFSDKIAVQHHHAHIASCMAENNLSGDVIGVAFDGTGYGEDGNLWGGEFFTGNYKRFQRFAHLQYIKMPGGEQAIKEPWRMALSCLYELGEEYMGKYSASGIISHVSELSIDAVMKVLEKNINCPLTSSMGRLFDAVSALVGIMSRISYEGQAAILLEHAADKHEYGAYSYEIIDNGEVFCICTNSVIKSIIEDIKNGISVSVISSKFHSTIAEVVLEICGLIRKKTGLDRVILSGGVFQNITLLERSIKRLENSGFRVYIHSKIPANDGGICLGQAVIAAARLMD